MNIKKIIAREGLIVLAIIIISVFGGGNTYQNFWMNVAPNIKEFPYGGAPTIGGSILGWMVALSSFYFLYWLIRFIIWAVRTLRSKT